jgi:3',5'-cyclic AMP phosphodiesterase CpdA
VGRDADESSRALSAAVTAVLGLEPRPHAVLVSGDLVNDPRAPEYERVAELLAPLPMPVHLLAGNHDHAALIREHFPTEYSTGADGEPFRYSTAVGDLRLIACDTTMPGREDGSFDSERLGWLERELAAASATPTIVAMHHPPLLTGLTALDQIGLPPADREALAELLAANPQVLRVVCGHVHRGAFGMLGGCGVFACPSTDLQAPLEIGMQEIHLTREPPAIALHVLTAGELVSHLQPLVRAG